MAIRTTLGAICCLKGGSAFKPAFQGAASGQHPFIKVSDLGRPGNETAIAVSGNWVSSEDLRAMKVKLIPAGATVFAKIGEALRSNRLRVLVRPTAIDNNMMAAVPDRNLVRPRYLLRMLSQHDLGELAVGTALPYLTSSRLSELPVLLPSLDEQDSLLVSIDALDAFAAGRPGVGRVVALSVKRLIDGEISEAEAMRIGNEAAAALGPLDDKIELNRRMNETLEEMARALFKSWFVDFDPVRAKAEGRDPGLPKHLADLFPDRLVDSELGPIPDGWHVLPLDQIAQFLNGLALQKYPHTSGPFLPVIKIAQLRKGDSEGSDRANTEVPSQYVVSDGDVLFSWSGSLECEVWAGGPGALNQHLFKVTSAVYPRWLLYLAVRHHLDGFRAIAADKATTMGHIKRGHLSGAMIALPRFRLLDAMGVHVGSTVDAAHAGRLEARSLGELRDTLLPTLIDRSQRPSGVVDHG